MEAHPKRTLVFQIIKLTIGALIAVCLVKFAFFPAQDAPTPSNVVGEGVFTQPTVKPERRTIENSLTLKATVVHNERTRVKSTVEGEIVKVFVNSGNGVESGAPLVQVKQAVESPNPEAPPSVKWLNVTASASGTLTMDAIVGQRITIGETLGWIQPESFHAEVAVTPDQLYALQSLPDDGELTLTSGPEPFACTGLRTVTARPSEDAAAEGAEPAGSSKATLRCDVPGDSTVFDGVTGKLTISGSKAENVLAVPVTAVEGRYKTGRVYTPSDSSLRGTPVSVEVGLTDGEYVEIVSGLDEGQDILQFAPAAEPTKDSNESMYGKEG